MYIAKVIGNVVSTIKHPFFEGRKLLLVQKVGLNNTLINHYDIAVDDVLAGIGDKVLIVDEGSGARQILYGGTGAPVRAVVAGIIDDVDIKIT